MEKILLLLVASVLSLPCLFADTNDPSTPNSPMNPAGGVIVMPTPTPTPTPGTNSTSTNDTPVVNQTSIPLCPIPLNYMSLGVQADFCIAQTCVSTRQYCAFLNAVARYSDPYGLYPKLNNFWHNQDYLIVHDSDRYSFNDDVQTFGVPPTAMTTSQAQITIHGGDLPVTYVPLLSAVRFCNWIENGQPTNLGEGPGSTETGAYTINISNNPVQTTITPNPNAYYQLLSFYPTSNRNTPGYDTNSGTVNEWAEALATGFLVAPQDQWVTQWTDLRDHNQYGGFYDITVFSGQVKAQQSTQPVNNQSFRLIWRPIYH